MTSIVWALHHKLPGEVWQPEEIAEVQKQLEPYGFNMDVVESVNVHDDIKIGLPSRDQYIENYKQTIRNLAPFGVKVICFYRGLQQAQHGSSHLIPVVFGDFLNLGRGEVHLPPEAVKAAQEARTGRRRSRPTI